MAKQPEVNIVSVLQMMKMEMRADDKKAEQQRLDDRERRDEERREEELRREERMMLALRAAQPAVPQTVTIVNHKFPEMKEGEEIDTFIAIFAAALRANNIPEDLWKAKLHSHLNQKKQAEDSDSNTRLRLNIQ